MIEKNIFATPFSRAIIVRFGFAKTETCMVEGLLRHCKELEGKYETSSYRGNPIAMKDSRYFKQIATIICFARPINICLPIMINKTICLT